MSNVLFPAQSKVFQVNTLSGGSLTTSLVSYWAMEGSSGDFFGTNYGTDTSVTYGTSYGKINQGANFGGSSGAITLSSYPTTGTGNFSTFAWVKTTITGARQTIASWGKGNSGTNTGTYLFINPSNKLEFDLSNVAGPSSAATITDGNWHLVGVVNSGGTVQLYVDGSASGSSVSMSPNITALNGSFIGRDIDGGHYLNGYLDEVGIWSKALSTNEISDLYNGGAGQTMCNGTGGPLCSTPRQHIILISLNWKPEHFNYV